MNKREIVRELRLKLREYFPDIQSHLDQNIITKNDWKFFGIIQFNLIESFTVSPEKAIRESKIQINKIIKFYEQETRIRKLALKSELFIDENKINQNQLEEKFEYYQSHLDYWKKRKNAKEMYFHYEVYLFLYYKWMNNYELDVENTLKLILDLMNFCSYYSSRYFNLEKLGSDRNNLINAMKISSHVLKILEIDSNNTSDIGILLQEARAHIE